MMFYKYLIFTYIICNDCILSNFNICAKEGAAKLRDGKILEPGADGYVEFVGEIVCSKGGNTCCTMEECIDLYDKI